MSAVNGEFWTQQFLKADGTPYAGVRVFHYVAGNTTTNLDVFQNGDLTNPHSNPVVGDATGRVSFYGEGTYRLLIVSSTNDGNVTLYNWDPVELAHHTATLRAEDRGLSLPAASALSRGRIFATTDTGSDLTGLWIQRTAAAWQEILTLPTLSQMIEFNKGSTIASSTNVTIPSDGNFFDITGTNTIESFSGFAGYPVIYTRTLSSLTFVYSANLVLQGGQNRIALPNQLTAWLHLGAGQWAELFYTNALLGDGVFTDGAVLVGNGTSGFVDAPLPTAGRTLVHTGVAGTDPFWGTGLFYTGPTAVGTGSTQIHEGNVTIAANQNLSGVHLYTNFTLNAGITVTVPTGKRRLIILASDTITINGAITATGAGATGGAGANVAVGTNGVQGNPGTDQEGAQGGTSQVGIEVVNPGSGGLCLVNGCGDLLGARRTASELLLVANVMGAMGGAGGGGGGATNLFGGQGGTGGGSIVLIAPTVQLNSGATLTANGTAGQGVVPGSVESVGGTGGAGNVYVIARVYTDNGAIFNQTGAYNGVKEIVLYL